MAVFKKLVRSASGAKVPHNKNTENCETVKMPVPKRVSVAMSMHIGAPAVACVKKGTEVKVGDVIGTAGGFISAPVHSPVSGKVFAVDELMMPNGNKTQVVVIDTDGRQTVSENVKPPVVTDYASFIEAIKASGLVGLGGAGFPASVKLSPKNLDDVDTLIINGAECEPYITADYREMIENSADVIEGAKAVKQYLNIAGKPIIIHTLEKFYVNDKFEKIIVLCPNQWVNHTENLIKKYIGENDKIVVISGGSTRNETIMNAIAYIEDHYTIDDDSVIVTHDSVRPFVTHRIIEENIKYAQEYGACDTVVPATDTIVKSMDNEIISEIPDRSKMYQGQTPQSFKIKKLKSLYEGLSEEEKTILTDAAKIFVIKGEKVHLVEGEVSNTKITYPYDLRVAETLISEK